MLIRFVVNNFLSFNEEREFNMLAGSFKTHKHHVYNIGKVDVLKAAAIYGANGAGKSNLIRAIDYLRELVKNGAITKSVSEKKFKLNKKNSELPISLEVEFSVEKKIYVYGIEIDLSTVQNEWLYESGITKDDKLIFERKLAKNGKPSIEMNPKFIKTKKEQLLIELMEDNLLKNNELLISKTDNLKIKEIQIAKNWFESNLIVIHPHSKFGGLVPWLSSNKSFKSFTNNLLHTFDTGIHEVDTETIELEKYFGEGNEEKLKYIKKALDENGRELLNGNELALKLEGKYLIIKAFSFHKDNEDKNVHFELEEESDGTQRLLDFIPAIEFILKNEITVIIDEIDHSLHPALLKGMVHKIMSDKSTKGQLIFTTHESNLLDMDLFRQDEIWFTEKDKNTGGTQLYSLSDFKPRYDLDIRKGYLKGRFGAIPFLAHLDDLNWHAYDA